MNDDVQKQWLTVLDAEIRQSKNNMDFTEFDSILDMLECVRSEKDYQWMSNKFLPEFAAIIWTDASGWANQMFQTRDFVDTLLEGDNPIDQFKCKAAKVLLNKTLNRKDHYFYLKYIKARVLNSLMGYVYAICRWDQRIEYSAPQDMLGMPIESILVDRFDHEVLDPRNVFESPEYAYSVRQKKYVTIREEISYDDLIRDKDSHGYFNLNKVRDLVRNKQLGQSQTSKETYTQNTTPPQEDRQVSPLQTFDKYERYGLAWMMIQERNQWNEITRVTSGIDRDGNIRQGAELVEGIITKVNVNGTDVLIRFQATPFYDATGQPYRPLIKGLCYPHPTKNMGLGDGKYLREMQISVNDAFNMGFDRQKLAMMPTLKGKKYSLVDNDTIFFEPEHVMELENVDDIQEVKIEDNIQGSLQTIGVLVNFMDKLAAVYPTTMGNLPDKASTTATAIAGADQRTNQRGNFKNLTIEYTYNNELYWMILNMSYRYMKPKTAEMILGKLAAFFDPTADYTYQPVSANIETEYNKKTTLQIIDQFIGRCANIPNPNTPKLLNYLLSRAFDLFGDRFPNYQQYLLDESAEAAQSLNKGNEAKDGSIPTTNQSGQPMSALEQSARQGATGELMG